MVQVDDSGPGLFSGKENHFAQAVQFQSSFSRGVFDILNGYADVIPALFNTEGLVESVMILPAASEMFMIPDGDGQEQGVKVWIMDTEAQKSIAGPVAETPQHSSSSVFSLGFKGHL